MMKKILAVVLVMMLVVVTGCGNKKTLKCNTSIMGLEQDVNVTYKGDDIDDIKMVMSYEKDQVDSLIEQGQSMDTLISSLESSVCSTYSSYDGVKCDVKDDNGGLVIAISIDYPKLDQDAKDDLSFNYQSYDDLKSDLEDQGYTCK